MNKMNQEIKVSVIIPAYNTEKYIPKAIDSVLKQTLKNIEIVIVDDCSTDDTVKVVQSFNDPRLRLLLNSQNMGAGGARNRAISAAKGKWIAVLDSDDWYAPERLEKLVKVAEQNKANLVVDDLYLIEDGSSSPWGTMIGESKQDIASITSISAADFVRSNIEGKKGLRLGFSKPILERDFLIKHNIRYNPNLKIGEDFWLYMECFLHGATFFLVPEPHYFYLARPNSLVCGDKIERLEKQCYQIGKFLENKDYLTYNPQVNQALLLHQSESQRWLDYYRVVEPLKQGKISAAVIAMAQNPKFFQHLSSQIPKVVKRRLNFGLGNTDSNNQKSIFQT